ncbi:ABC transporter permease [Micromonospora sp. CA-263727]|uniref:ABC transporter permease n=1 Tax=Micromonospora sp. CA-263727 TaxID=3239967 RepID=UPI003D8AB15D
MTEATRNDPQTSLRVGATMRYLARAWRLELRQLLTSRLYLFVAVFLPLIIASVAFYMTKGSQRPIPVLSIALSAALMGMWSTTLLGAGNAITRLRHISVLEPLVASPMPTILFTLPFAIATASLGLYSLVATLVWSAVFFDLRLETVNWWLLVSIPVTVLSLGMLGLLMASAFILYPTAQSLANLFEYPVWMLSGMLVPVSALPGALQAVSTVLAPTWGVKAVHGAAMGDGDPLVAVGMCLLLSGLYLGVTLIVLRRFEWLARSSGTLSLR